MNGSYMDILSHRYIAYNKGCGVKKRLATLLLTLPLCFFSQASDWFADKTTHSIWVQQPSPECTNWSPQAETVDWGLPFYQKRDCQYTEKRDKIITEIHAKTKQVRERSRHEKTRLINQKERRKIIGKQDKVLIIKRHNTWSDWERVTTERKNCLRKVDVASEFDLNKPVFSTQYCQEKSWRRKSVVQHWLSGKTRHLIAQEKKQEQWFPRIYLSLTQGQKDRWLPAVKEYGAWLSNNTKASYCKGNWTLDENQVVWQSAFLNYQTCFRSEERTVKTVRYTLSQQKEALKTETEVRQVPFYVYAQQRGLLDSVLSRKEKEIKPWETINNNCSALPNVAHQVDWDEHYTSYLNCTQTQEKITQWVSVKRSGAILKEALVRETRSQSYPRIRHHSGGKDALLEKTNTFKYGKWVAQGGLSCSRWLPPMHHVNAGVQYIQSRTCEQEQSQPTQQLTRWHSGEKWINSLDKQRVFTWYETRNERGVKLIRSENYQWDVTLNTGKNSMGKPLTINQTVAYERMEITVTSQHPDAMTEYTVMLRDPQGEMLQLPKVKSEKQVFYFNLIDYQLTVSGEWVLLINSDNPTSEKALKSEVSVTFAFEKKREVK
jgi:hypothetical protein